MEKVFGITKRNLAIAALSLFPFVSTLAHADDDQKSLSQLQNMNAASNQIDKLTAKNVDRMRAMKDAAIGIGAQHGYVAQMKENKKFILTQANHLDSEFDFATLMKLSGDKISGSYLLPAVIEVVKDAEAVSDDGREFRASGTVYRIKSKERLVSAPPNWREYLLWDLEADLSKPHEQLLPKTPDEVKAWKGWVKEGYYAGISQAQEETKRRTRRLGADFSGMVRYTRLVVEGKASEAKVLAQHRAVVGGGDMMRESDSIYRVSHPVSLNPDSKRWKSIITDPRTTLRAPAEFTDME